ncbi:MAG TPA: MFS transporter [Patescibacteria group bacterium]
MVRRVIHTYWLLAVVTNAATGFFAPIYTTYLMAKGLSLGQAQMVNFVYFTICLTLEMPTGALADVFGRKRCYVISRIVIACAYFTYATASGVPGFIMAEVLAGIGSCLASGAFQAWLRHSLTHHGYTGELDDITGKSYILNCVTGFATAQIGALSLDHNVIRSVVDTLGKGVLASWIEHHFLVLPWVFGGSLMGCNAVIALVLMQDHHVSHQNLRGEIWDHLQHLGRAMQRAVRYAVSSSDVRLIVCMALLFAVATQAPNMQWQPLMKGQYGFPQAMMGVVWIGISLALASGGALCVRLKSTRFDRRYTLLCSLLVVGVGISTTPYLASPALMMTAFLFNQMGRGVFRPMIDAYANDQIPKDQEDHRATVLSLTSMPSHLGSMLGLAFSARIAEAYTIPVAWRASGMLLVVGACILLFVVTFKKSLATAKN